MCPHKVRAALRLLAICFLCFGQGRIVAQSEFQQKRLDYVVSVNLKLVQVTVLDKSGKPVPDLSKSDFVLYDDGKIREITDFEIYNLRQITGPSTSLPFSERKTKPGISPLNNRQLGRRFFIFLDYAFNNPTGIKKAKEAALQFLKSELDAFDEIGLISYSAVKGLKINEYLTSDRAKIKAAIEATGVKDIAGRADDVEDKYWREAQEGGVSNTTKFERSASKNQVLNYLNRMVSLAKALRYIPGEKYLMLFSTGIPGSLLYSHQAGLPGNPPPGYIPFASQPGLPGALYESGDFNLRALSEDLNKELSAANCRVFSFDTRESALVSNLFKYDEETFAQSRYLFTEDGVRQSTNSTIKDNALTGLDTLKRTSDMTGGSYFPNIFEAEKSIEQVQRITGTYYVLGYYVSEPKDGRYHDIKIEVKRKGCEIRAQRGYFNPKPYGQYSDLEKELHLFDLALAATPLFQEPLRFSMVPAAFLVGEKPYALVIAKMTDSIKEKFAGKKIETILIIFDEKENVATISKTMADFPKKANSDIYYVRESTLPPGEYRCRLILRDVETGDAAVASAFVFISIRKDSSVQLLQPLWLVEKKESSFIGDERARPGFVPAWKKIYSFDSTQYMFLGGEAPLGTKSIYALVPCLVFGTANEDISVIVKKASTGEKIDIPIRIVDRIQNGDTETTTIEFSTKDLVAGKYTFYFYVGDKKTSSVTYSYAILSLR